MTPRATFEFGGVAECKDADKRRCWLLGSVIWRDRVRTPCKFAGLNPASTATFHSADLHVVRTRQHSLRPLHIALCGVDLLCTSRAQSSYSRCRVRMDSDRAASIADVRPAAVTIGKAFRSDSSVQFDLSAWLNQKQHTGAPVVGNYLQVEALPRSTDL